MAKRSKKQVSQSRPNLRALKIYLDTMKHAEMIKEFEAFMRFREIESDSLAGRLLIAKGLRAFAQEIAAAKETRKGEAVR